MLAIATECNTILLCFHVCIYQSPPPPPPPINETSLSYQTTCENNVSLRPTQADVLNHMVSMHPVMHLIPDTSWFTLHWRHNERDGVSNHRRLDGWLKRLFRYRSKKTPKLHLTGEFLSQKTSDAEKNSIWWRHHDTFLGDSYTKR